MPRKPGKVPGYCRHKSSGQAVVRLDGQDHYLGPYGSPESHELYERLIAEWRVRKQEQPHRFAKRSANDLTVEELLGLYWIFAKSYYVRDGQPTKELTGMKYAMKPLRRLYARLPARDFGPLALKAVRQAMIEADLCRTQVNSRTNRIRRIFKWAVGEELIHSSVYEALRAVNGLVYGRTTARESPPVRPVDDADVTAVLPYVSAQVAAMIQLQRLTGMRPDEVVQLRMCEVEDAGEVWLYRPFAHKNRWRGHDRPIALGPQAQALVKAFLPREASTYVFSPREAEAARNQRRRERRRSPMTPSQAKRTAVVNPKRVTGDCYDVDSYRRAINYGIRMARRAGLEVAHWAPNQLRHTRATEIRRKFGVEAAQCVLGHTRADVTQIYAERNLDLAIQIARESG